MPTPPDQIPGTTHPRAQNRWLGDPHALETLQRALRSRRLAHAWLLEGPMGVGKATLAYRFARALLDPTHVDGQLAMDAAAKTARLVAGQGHPDLVVVNRPWDDKIKGFRTEIPIATVREGCESLSRTASFGERRVLIVDALDDLSTGGSDALLKTLEEPPGHGVLILIAHHAGAVRTTIRSRCRRLRVGPPPHDKALSILATEAGLEGQQGEDLLKTGGGSPGMAMRRIGSEAILRAVQSLLSAKSDTAREHAVASFGASVASGDAEGFNIATTLLSDAIIEQARHTAIQGDIAKARHLGRIWSTIQGWAEEGEDLRLEPYANAVRTARMVSKALHQAQ